MSDDNTRILITGGTGLLGKYLIESAGNHCLICATYLGDYNVPDQANIRYIKADVLDLNTYQGIFRDFKPQVVIHTASIGSPDYAEKNKEITWQINVESSRNMLKLSVECGSKIIYISSNGIYDGLHAPYGEDDQAEPINYYGRTKLEGERVFTKAKVPYAIVRPILMYGWNHGYERTNIVTHALKQLSQGKALNVYDDVYSNPLYAGDCARAIWKMIDNNKYETFNLAGRERASVFGLIRKAAQVFGLNAGNIIPVKQGFFNELVPRPVDTSYRIDKMERLLFSPLNVEEGLAKMKETE